MDRNFAQKCYKYLQITASVLGRCPRLKNKQVLFLNDYTTFKRIINKSTSKMSEKSNRTGQKSCSFSWLHPEKGIN